MAADGARTLSVAACNIFVKAERTKVNAIISQPSLKKAVSQVIKGVGRNSELPIVNGILIEASDGTVSMRSTDMTSSIRTMAPATVEEAGSTVVSGRMLESIVKSLPDDAVTIRLDGRTAVVSCRRASYRLNTLDPKDFPDFPEVAPDEVVELPVSTLSDMASKVARCTSKDQSRPILGCVQLSVDGDLMRLVSTDSYRLMVCDTNLSSEGSFCAAVPSKALTEALKMADPSGTIEVGMSMNQVVFRSGSAVYVTRRVDGSFPDYRMLMPNSHEVSVHADVTILGSALKHVSVMAKENPTVRVSVDGNAMTLMSTSILDGESSETIDVDSDGTIAFAVNSKYLADGLDCAGDDVSIELVSPVHPVVMKSYGQVNCMYLLMPVRA